MEHKRVPIDCINFGERFRSDDGDLDALARSIKELGLLQPIVVTPHPEDGYLLIAGKRRVRACQKLGWSMIDAQVVEMPNRLTQLYAERDENETHKPFTPSEGVAIAKAVAAELGERRGRPADEESAPIPEKSENVDHGPHFLGEKTRDIAAQAGGFQSGKQYERAKAVLETGNEELIAAMDAGEISISKAAKLARELNKAVRARKPPKGKSGKKRKTPLLVNVFDDSQIDKLIDRLAGLIEARGRAFCESQSLKNCLDRLEAFAAEFYEWAGKPAPEQEIIPDALNTPEFRTAWDAWKKYRKEIKHALAPTTRRRQLQMMEQWGVEAAIKAIDTSITKGWHGLFESEAKASATHDTKHDAEAQNAWLDRTAQRRREQGIQA